MNCEESDCSLVNCHIVFFFGAWCNVVFKALRYYSGGPGIDSRWCLEIFFMAPDGTMCPGVDSASESEYQGLLVG